MNTTLNMMVLQEASIPHEPINNFLLDKKSRRFFHPFPFWYETKINPPELSKQVKS